MKDYLRGYISEIEGETKRVACVGHSFHFKFWTGEWEDPEKRWSIIPDKVAWVLKNVEFYPDAKNFPLSQSTD